MQKIFSLLAIFGIIFVFGCSNEEPTTISAAVIEEIESEEKIVEIIEEERENITTVRLCHDTDNGIVRWVNGSVFGFYNNATRFEFNDYCQNFNYLWEFYCENETPMQRIFLCTNGCENNHCL
ncbi:MAG: hypothetical protein QF655_02000 [Candidatus Woesearchaeota archaeon]|jgi:hypothetical protein|nr:hypothetical protein [Candidatus Woesearchaeota archaeon]